MTRVEFRRCRTVRAHCASEFARVALVALLWTCMEYGMLYVQLLLLMFQPYTVASTGVDIRVEQLLPCSSVIAAEC